MINIVLLITITLIITGCGFSPGIEETGKEKFPGQPFFSIINIFVTHESQIWNKSDDPLKCPPEKVKVPPYFPDTRIVRKDIARAYSNIVEMDSIVGMIISELEEDKLMDSTYVIFLSDHGGPLPRQKREILDAGFHSTHNRTTGF